MIAQVAVSDCVYAIDRPYSYRIPDGLTLQDVYKRQGGRSTIFRGIPAVPGRDGGGSGIMIYLDAAATTLQKPDAVRLAVLRAMQRLSLIHIWASSGSTSRASPRPSASPQWSSAWSL